MQQHAVNRYLIWPFHLAPSRLRAGAIRAEDYAVGKALMGSFRTRELKK